MIALLTICYTITEDNIQNKTTHKQVIQQQYRRKTKTYPDIDTPGKLVVHISGHTSGHINGAISLWFDPCRH